ncbi:LysR family transcriptional regulator [Photobacterium gaetbulicola]|uniref:LysR family transcriptional regulator n=2 Tax=Photobacterium gaetbulicola TaxID=1295392 RepID=A0A0B9H340_9GAMM|nr:LysR family transcriptional regulator [Photobacterium gaetbulicola]AJR05835.1 putative transcriptional regulator, LysR family [Photobacterium gaetbulicola Gung47]KHT65326.1 LysR family transcriptional regulator [Photobacterium gaetbulicola]PSU13346.1 LysR family transcriptional regulator [Photobacterium gaetbulicola]
MDIEAVKMFALLAKKLNYTETAKALDVSQPTLSRKIKALEQDLNVTLVHRRGNNISLTPQGEAFLESATKILDLIDHTVEQLHVERKGISGQLRIGCLHPMARFLTKFFLPSFHEKHPNIHIHFHTLTPCTLTLFEDVDLMIAPFWLSDESVVCRKVSTFVRCCYASPAYLKKQGVPQFVHDLELHQCITQTNTPNVERYWNLQNRDGNKRQVEVSGDMTTNSIDIAINLALGGFGIGLIPANQVREYVESGELVRLFDGNWFEQGELFILYKQSLHTPQRYKVFIEEFEAFHYQWGSGLHNLE